MSRVDAWEKPCKDDDADDKAPSARSVDSLPASAKDEISRGAGEAGLSGLSSKRPPADAKGQPPAARAERKWPSETVRPDGKRDRDLYTSVVQTRSGPSETDLSSSSEEATTQWQGRVP